MGEHVEFQRAVHLLSERISFRQNVTVQLFETTIRVLGGLLSAHLLIVDRQRTLGDLRPDGYDDQLLRLADQLGQRLTAAFQASSSPDSTASPNHSIPYPRINLQSGLYQSNCSCPRSFDHSCTLCTSHTCTAAVGSLSLEFGVLARLTGNWTYDRLTRDALDSLWARHSARSGLPGNELDAATGRWTERMCGVGAGLDSYYEYLLKAYALFGDNESGGRFRTVYESLLRHARRGRSVCNPSMAPSQSSSSSSSSTGNTFAGRWSINQQTQSHSAPEGHPLFVNVHMHSGHTFNTWLDSLQAAFPGVLVLAGQVEEAICSHAFYYALWRRFSALPERFDWRNKQVDLAFYPLRPELAESTYFLYRATANPFYLHVGQMILESIDRRTRTSCGFATLHDVRTKQLEDRMESFFLSETCKYLYLVSTLFSFASLLFPRFVWLPVELWLI